MLLLAALLAVAPPSLPADTVDAATARALDAANAAFSRAVVAGDAAVVVAAYHDDAVLHPPAGGVLVGTDRVREFWGGLAPGRNAGHRLEANYRRELAPGVVLEIGRWHSQGMRDGVPGEWTSGCYTVIWRRDDAGAWRLQYDGWTNPIEADWACVPR
jgi:ketosteroid isomerase-like protein